MLARVLSALFWTTAVIIGLFFFPIALLTRALTAPFDPQLRVLHQLTCFWASTYSWMNPAWRLRIEGREKVRPRVAYVMVSNHQSVLDILILFRLFVHFKWVSKIEIFRSPLVGWNMRLNRYIKLRRGNEESIAEMMEDCERTLKAGSSLMMFPEGTRSIDGKLKSFKHGAFTLAQRVGAPILPIVVQGTVNALPKRSLLLRGAQKFRIRILDEIPYATFADKPVETLIKEVREIMSEALEESPAPRTKSA